MGYRSDVAYVVAFHHTEKPEVAHAEFLAFQEWVKQHTVDEEEGMAHKAASPKTLMYGYSNAEEDCDHFKWYPQDGVLMVRLEDVKWYEHFPEVKWHEGLLMQCLGYQTGAYRFVRVGENYNDIEVDEKGEPDIEVWHYLDVQRSISFSPPHETEDKEAT